MENLVTARARFETECEGDIVKLVKYKDGTCAVVVSNVGASALVAVISNATARAIGAALQSMGSES